MRFPARRAIFRENFHPDAADRYSGTDQPHAGFTRPRKSLVAGAVGRRDATQQSEQEAGEPEHGRGGGDGRGLDPEARTGPFSP
jgi:hypothetical protein